MNIGLFGGTFDPIHNGHIALARGAQERFQLGCIYFVPANIPPHKQRHPVTPFFHRYAMVALATMNEKAFVPSLLEAPADVGLAEISSKKGKAESAKPAANYTIDTVRQLKSMPSTKLRNGTKPRRSSANVNSLWPAARDILSPM
jgi:cytidyltransferase-like protein